MVIGQRGVLISMGVQLPLDLSPAGTRGMLLADGPARGDQYHLAELAPRALQRKHITGR